MAGNGGIIGPTNTVTNGCAACASASGMWQMNTVYNYVKNSDWVYNFVSQDYLVVAGGGSGQNQSGGGGGGGYRASGYGPAPLRGTALSQKWGSFAVTVGAGGVGDASGQSAQGQVGTDSIFNPGGVENTSTITGDGGGGGGGGAGGSGGGAGSEGSAPVGYNAPGPGNNPPRSPISQGNAGGTMYNCGPVKNSGGGGGAGGAGGNAPSSLPANGTGGVGVPNAITGSAVSYAGGGGAGGFCQGVGGAASPCGTGGIGGNGGGNGSPPGFGNTTAGSPGTAARGGGGGGSGRDGGGQMNYSAGNGGDGVVIIRVPTAQAPNIAVAPGSNSLATDGSCKVATFTVTGTLTI